MKNSLIIVLMAQMLLSISCKKEKSMDLSAMIEILVVNQQSQNLLTKPDILNESNIDMYYFNNGQAILFYQNNLGAPKGFLIKPLDGLSDVGLKVYNHNTGTPETTHTEYPVTLIKFGNLGTDTIKCEVLNGENYKVVSKVWYNGILKYDQALKMPRRFTVIK